MLSMIINKAKQVNYWAMPSIRKQKLSLKEKQTMANEIIAKVCIRYGVSNEGIRGKKRVGMLIMARHMSMYLIRTRAKLTLKSIGDLFGRDHTTVINAIKSIKDQSDVYYSINEDIQNFNNIL